MTERIAFIGFGEAGQTISRGLLAQGGSQVCAYDVLFDDPEKRAALLAAAERLGVTAKAGHAAAVLGADIVFLAVTASSSLEAAKSCLPALRSEQWLADLGVKARLGGAKTEDRATLVAVIRAALGR